MIRIVTAFALLAIATPALADPAPQTATTPDPNKVRCKREVVTGSLIASKKVCHTEAEWKEVTEQARRDTQQMQSAASAGGGGH